MTSTKNASAEWFEKARFGMFIHYGPYAQLGRGEWVMAQEGWTRAEYETFADRMTTDPAHVRSWVRLAKKAGMRYAVFTAKHHDGFCQWQSNATGYNSVTRGPKLDLVREFVTACREEGVRTGLYYSLADWHHPDGADCAVNMEARERFLNFTRQCLSELLGNYGTIDLLWFDGPWPLGNAENWNAGEMVSLIRTMQPAILLNDRLGNGFTGDFETSERSISSKPGLWEACMTMNDDWGYSQRYNDEWVTVKDIAMMLRKCSIGGGNLLLNVGPMGNGELPVQSVERLTAIGKWLEINGEAVYPQSRMPGERLPFISNTGYWSLNDTTAYYWLSRTWPGTELQLGGLEGDIVSAQLLGCPSKLTWEKHPQRLTISGLPDSNPDPYAHLPIMSLTFSTPPRQKFPYPHTEFIWDT